MHVLFTKKKKRKIFEHLRGYTSSLRGFPIVVKLEGVKRGDERQKEGREGSAVRGRANWIATYISIQQMKIDFDAVPLITPLLLLLPLSSPPSSRPPLLASHCRASFNECKNAETGKAAQCICHIREKSGQTQPR